MRTTPWRRTTLQFLQIFLTDARTFIFLDDVQVARSVDPARYRKVFG